MHYATQIGKTRGTETINFGGLTAIREIAAPAITGYSGFLFVFVLRQRVTREDSDECLLQFAPVFATVDGQIDEAARIPDVTQAGTDGPPQLHYRVTPQWRSTPPSSTWSKSRFMGLG